eukprot:COSAG01_NODE_3868_length_5606_cov_2.027601_5_plen_59_part_00
MFHILSRDVVLRYLQSLLELWQYDTFFIHVMELHDSIGGLPFGDVRANSDHIQFCIHI